MNRPTYSCPRCGNELDYDEGDIGVCQPLPVEEEDPFGPHNFRKVGSMSIQQAPLQIGTTTPWGPVGAVVLTGGERYYMMASRRDGAVALLPADVVEPNAGLPEEELDASSRGK